MVKAICSKCGAAVDVTITPQGANYDGAKLVAQCAAANAQMDKDGSVNGGFHCADFQKAFSEARHRATEKG